MKKISSGDADLAVFEAEDILIAADDSHLSDILITHKIHASEDSKYAIVCPSMWFLYSEIKVWFG